VGTLPKDRTAEVAALRARVRVLAPRMQSDLAELVRIPSIAFPGFPSEPVEQAARAVASQLAASCGVSGVRLLPIPDGPPAVFAQRPAPSDAPTVLLYAHYDVQPPGDETAWSSPPFAPTVRGGRLYGRGAADNKSGVVLHANALRAVADCPNVGIKVLIEGEEEAGLGSLEAWVRRNPEIAAADVIVVADLGNARLGTPTLTTSLRGFAAVEVEIETLRAPVHSGSFGGAAPDALLALTKVLATLVDDRGDAAVPGLEAVAWDGADYPEDQFRTDAGVIGGVDLLGDGRLSERLWTRPAITVTGLDAPPVEGALNAVPGRARAKVTVRVPPGRSPADARAALRRHLEAVVPWHAKVTVHEGSLGEGFLAVADGRASVIVKAALQDAFGAGVVRVGQGGSVPLVAAFHDAAPEAEIILFGAEEPSCRIHSADESVSLDELERCVLAEALFLTRLGERPAEGDNPSAPTATR
jgi:cysteinylglycine-S-conjugate dipeptidase